ncbi:hypothetical protein TNCV_2287841 [Trichonephila clavipes]|nr:hypothetical protein TNCV_2287841 [Trichonephila clavipes]
MLTKRRVSPSQGLWSSQATESSLGKKNVQFNRRITVLQIEGNLYHKAIVNVFEQTVCRTLHRIDYGSQRPVLKPLLFTLNKNRWLQFTKKHKNWTVTD